MNINRRTLMLLALAVGLLGVVPAFAGADEESGVRCAALRICSAWPNDR